MLRYKKACSGFALAAFIAATTLSFFPVPIAQASGIIAAENSVESALANVIFRILDIPVSVYDITDLKTTRNMGHGEIALAYNLAHASGQSINYILHLRFDQNMGWGKIAKHLGVKLRGPADKSDYILREARLDRDADDFKKIILVDLDDDDKDNNGKNDNSGNNGNSHGKGHGKQK